MSGTDPAGSDLGAVTVVIRAAGERTEAACRAAILAQGVDAAQLVTIREAPFSRAMRAGYQAGVDAGRPWTLTIDADVLLRPGAVAALLAQAARQPARVFEIQGFVLDKLFVTLREAGNHLFRTALLPQLIDCIPEEGTSLRPESTAMRPESTAMQRMAARGYDWVNVPYVVGLHDFEQSNQDIFRKSFTHAQKHLHLLPELLPKLRRRVAGDGDFAVMIEGLAEGLRAESEVRIDIRHRPFAERFAALAIPEKPPLPEGDPPPGAVEQILRDWAAAPDLTVRALPVSGPQAIALDGSRRFTALGRAQALVARKRAEIGMARTLMLAAAEGAERIGAGLRRISEKRG